MSAHPVRKGHVTYPKLLGVDIVPMCLCGQTVNPMDSPQKIEWDPELQCWIRLCYKCLGVAQPPTVNNPVDAALGGWPL